MKTIVPGQEIGPYRIIEQAGKGGMATVYKAYHAAMDRHVAIKILPFEFSGDPEFLQRFRREVITIARLEHPHILPVYDSGDFQGAPYLVMRYLDAGTLRDRIRQKRLSLPEIDHIVSQLSDALAYAHNLGVIHRDLKPTNIMLTERNDVLLTDFGIAKVLGAGTQITATGAITGTPAYMSPEQGDGSQIDQRSDIYSLGVVLYEMITGRVPFEAETPLAVILKHIQAPLPLPSSILPVHPAIERVILKTLAKQREDRYASAAEFKAAWKKAILASSMPEAPPTQQMPRPQAVSVEPQPARPPAPAAEARPHPTIAPVEGPPRQQPAPPQADSKPGRRWLWLGGVVALAVIAVCIFSVTLIYRACCAPEPDIAGQATEQASEQLPPDSAGTDGETVGQETETDGASEGTAPEATAPSGEGASLLVGEALPYPAEGGPFENFVGAGVIYTVALHNEQIIAGGPGGISVYDQDWSLVQRFTIADGLPTNSVFYLFSDEDTGDLWAATDAGAVRYDGESFTVYDEDDGLDKDYLNFVGRIGDLIVAGSAYSSDGGGINLFDGTSWTLLPGFDSTSGGSETRFDTSVWEAVVDDAGITWFATAHTLAAWDGANWTRYTTAEGLPNNFINGITTHPDGYVVATTEGGAAFFNGTRFESFGPTVGHSINDFIVDSNGDFWFPGGSGVFRFSPQVGDWEFFGVDLTFPAEAGFRGIADDQANVYFGTDGAGVVVFDGDGFVPLELPDGPEQFASATVVEDAAGRLYFVEEYGYLIEVFDPASEAWSVLELDVCCLEPAFFDSDGFLWGVGDTGLWRIDPEEGDATNFTTRQGLPSDDVFSVALMPDGSIWVGTDAGLAHLLGDLVLETVAASDLGLQSNEVYALLVDREGNLWAGVGDGLLRRDPQGDWETFSEGDPFEADFYGVSALAQGLDGSIWVGTDGSGVYNFLDDTWTLFTPEDPGVELPSPYINKIAVSPDGSLWFATESGAARFDGQTWDVWGPEEGLSHWNVNAILIQPDGTAWFATSGGISRWQP